MCIIFASADVDSRPTMDELEKSSKYNSDGSGLAWVEGGEVIFRRKLELAEFEPLLSIPGPMLFHFRMASSGGKDDTLIHPFPLVANQMNLMAGETTGVLAHNGTIPEGYWYPLLLAAGLKNLPRGPWSDSKALAYVISQTDNINILDLFDGWDKFLVLKPEGFYYFGSWIKQREGLWTSCSIPTSARTVYTGSASQRKKDWDWTSPGGTVSGRYDLSCMDAGDSLPELTVSEKKNLRSYVDSISENRREEVDPLYNSKGEEIRDYLEYTASGMPYSTIPIAELTDAEWLDYIEALDQHREWCYSNGVEFEGDAEDYEGNLYPIDINAEDIEPVEPEPEPEVKPPSDKELIDEMQTFADNLKKSVVKLWRLWADADAEARAGDEREKKRADNILRNTQKQQVKMERAFIDLAKTKYRLARTWGDQQNAFAGLGATLSAIAQKELIAESKNNEVTADAHTGT